MGREEEPKTTTFTAWVTRHMKMRRPGYARTNGGVRRTRPAKHLLGKHLTLMRHGINSKLMRREFL